MTIKKISALLMLSVLPLGVLTAQEEKDYLPKAGDWAIGIDMQPVYRFFGNIANGTQNNSLNQFGGEQALQGQNPGIPGIGVTIISKIMLDNTIALRANVGVGKSVDNHFDYRQDDKALFDNPLSEAKVEDKYMHNNAAYSAAVGIEFRKGKNRIQGYVGADLVFGLVKDRYEFTYGNALTELNQTPSRGGTPGGNLRPDGTPYLVYPYNNLGLKIPNYNPNGGGGVPYWTETFLTESYKNTIIGGVAGKVGVEYFVVPKLSFGGEVSLLVKESFIRGSYTTSEGYNPTTQQVETHTELVNPSNRQFFLGTTDMGGKLFMMFYF